MSISENKAMGNVNIYGGVNPPYSLYQGEDGKWGLINCNGKKLPAVFNRLDDTRFSCAPWEVVTFDPNEGFDLLAWYDPDEVWFNFTFGNQGYPEEFTKLLWKQQKHKLHDFSKELHELLPSNTHWLLDIMLQIEKLEDEGTDEADDEADTLIKIYLSQSEELHTPAKLNPLLYQVMKNKDLDEDIRIALWNSKVYLDFLIMDILNYQSNESDNANK